jgi:hypothetical protein
MELYNFKKLSHKLDLLNYPEITESRFEIVRKDFTEEENRGNITFKEDGIYLKINGVEHKGYMFIKNADVNQWGLPKFHVANCLTIIDQKNKGYFNGHYFWSNSNVVDVNQRNNKTIHENVKLELCGYCREQISIINYSNTQGFFDLLDIQVPEADNNQDLDMFGYVKDWQQISKKFRIENEFTCNNCSIKIIQKIDHRFIQVHHVNGNKKINVRDNLQCLCTLCHANVDVRHAINFEKKRSVHEIATFVKIYEFELIKLNNPYIFNYLNDS